MLLIDSTGRIALANGAASNLLGHSREALQRMAVHDLVPDHVAPRHAALRKRYADQPVSRPMGTDLELNAKHADGGLVMVEIALSPLHAYGHEYVVASMRGIGGYPRVKRAMQRARYNEFVVQLGRLAVDAIDPDELLQRVPAIVQEALEAGAISVSLLTHDQSALRVVSYTGPDEDEALRHVYTDLPDTVFGEVIAHRTPLIVTDFEHERRFAMPSALRRHGARSMLIVPLVDRGKTVGTLGAWSLQAGRFGEDEVSFLQSVASLLSTSLQRAQAEAQLRHSQRLETVGQLTGGVAHDFNNMLTVILGNLQILADQPECQGNSLGHQLVAAATRAGQRGADLTGKLLAFSRRQSLAPESVDPVAVVHSLADMLRRTLGERIRVVVQSPQRCPHCLADAVQLESALLNVAVNARDAMPQGGTLHLRCGVGAPPEVEGPQTRPARSVSCRCPRARNAGSGSACRTTALACRRRCWTAPSNLLHHQGGGPWHRPGPVDRVRVCQAVARSHHARWRARRGHHRHPVPAGDRRRRRCAHRGRGQVFTDAPAAGLARAAGGRRRRRAPGVAESFLAALGCEVLACNGAAAALAALGEGRPFDMLFSDIRLGAGIDGHELARRVVAQHP
ncbi:MAG: GAF domain-containing protein, partial [Betaproteobacteria bacterium]|nr:GAF domain-containing protein [Betaproteobacteria bacterium]